MLFTDTITLDGSRRTGDGYLAANARVARTGIQTYLGREVGKPEMAQVRVFRPESEVFADKALRSFAHRPVTNDHPAEAVGAKNWKLHAVGMTGDEIARDGTFIRVPMVVMDQSAIDDIDAGKRELSMGYACDLDWTAGTTPEGEAYDAIQTNIRGNHLAIVAAGRAGPQCRIGDSWAAISSPSEQPMKTLMVDGITVEMSDTAVQVVSKALQNLGDENKALTTKLDQANASLTTKDAAHATELAKKDAEIDGLKAKVLDDAALDARVQARSDLLAKAKVIAPTVATDGKTDAEIRHAVVAAKLGDAAVKDKPTAYIDARFDILAEDIKSADPVRDALKDGAGKTQLGDADAEYQRMLDRDRNAWKKDAA